MAGPAQEHERKAVRGQDQSWVEALLRSLRLLARGPMLDDHEGMIDSALWQAASRNNAVWPSAPAFLLSEMSAMRRP